MAPLRFPLSLDLLRRPWALPAAFLVLGLLALPLLVHPWFDYSWDGGMYLLGARSLARGEGYSASGVPITIRPPGLSLVLAPFARDRIDFRHVNTFTSVIGLVGATLLLVLVRPRLGGVLAFATAAVTWLNPAYQRWSNMPMSDVPGLAFLLAALLFEREAPRKASVWKEVVLGILLGAGSLVRMAVALAIPAIAASRLAAWWRDAPRAPFATLLRRLTLFPAVAVLILLPWSIRDSVVRPSAPADQTRNYSYGVAMLHEDWGDPGSPRVSAAQFIGRAAVRVPQLLGSLQTGLADLGETTPEGFPWFGVLLVGSILTLVAIRRGPVDGTALMNILAVAVYFAYDIRLALPVYALGAPAFLELLRRGASALAGPRTALVVALVALALIAVSNGAPRGNWARLSQVHERGARVTAELAAALPADARLAAWRDAPYWAVAWDRPVHVLRFGYERAPQPAALERLIDNYRINTVLLEPFGPPAAARQYLSRYPVLAERDGVVLLRVRP